MLDMHPIMFCVQISLLYSNWTEMRVELDTYLNSSVSCSKFNIIMLTTLTLLWRTEQVKFLLILLSVIYFTGSLWSLFSCSFVFPHNEEEREE